MTRTMKTIAARLRYIADSVPADEVPAELHTIAREIEDRAPGWQPIAEAPKDGTWLLVRGMNTVGQPMIPFVVSWNDGYGRCLGYAWRDNLTLTDVGHWIDPNAEWMPLPKPPSTARISKEWCIEKAIAEGYAEIGAGLVAADPILDAEKKMHDDIAKRMSCTCGPHIDAIDCANARYGTIGQHDRDIEPCECCCHETEGEE
jgi:hypothetical protein